MSKFYKITLIILLAGLVITGVGTAVAVMEVYGLEYKGEKYDNTDIEYTQTELELPDNLAKIFYTDFNMEFTEDETLPYNKVIIELGHRADYEVEPNCNVQTDLYLYNFSTDNKSKYPVNKLVMGWSAHSDFEEFDIFKTFLDDIKNGEIYSYDRPLSMNVTIRGSKASLERFKLLPDNYELRYYDKEALEESEEIVIDEAEQEQISENIEARDGSTVIESERIINSDDGASVYTAPEYEEGELKLVPSENYMPKGEEDTVKVVPVEPVAPNTEKYAYSYAQ